jgi:ATP-dependent RNA helicase DDX35
MKALGIGNLAKFEFITSPTEESFVRALELLYSLGALDKEGNLTNEIGSKLAEMPIDPRLGVILLNSGKKEFECSQEMLMLVSMLSAQNIFYAGTYALFQKF